MNKVWFVTGASAGIGAEVAKAALHAGHRVVATARNLEKLRSILGAELAEDRLALVSLDVSSEAQVKAAVETAVSRFGRVDVVVNNAGYSLIGNFETLTQEQIERQLATNFFGVLYVMRAALPILRRQRSGHIFNVSSLAGVIGFKHCSAYAASKFAVEGLSLSVAQEVEPFGIKVTLVEPGFVRTDLLAPQSILFGDIAIDDYGAPGDVKPTGGPPPQAGGRPREVGQGSPRARRDGGAAEAVLRRQRRHRDDRAGFGGSPQGDPGPRRPLQVDGRHLLDEGLPLPVPRAAHSTGMRMTTPPSYPHLEVVPRAVAVRVVARGARLAHRLVRIHRREIRAAPPAARCRNSSAPSPPRGGARPAPPRCAARSAC